MLSRKSMVLLVVIGLVVLAVAPSASAAKPDTLRYEQVLTELEVGDCPDGSTVLEDSTLRITERFFFDKDGNLTRLQVKGDVVEARLYIDEKGSLPVAVHFIYTFYPDDGSLISRGLVGRVNVPGAGHVLLDAGRLVWDGVGDVVFEAGHHQYVNGELDELCEALS